MVKDSYVLVCPHRSLTDCPVKKPLWFTLISFSCSMDVKNFNFLTSAMLVGSPHTMPGVLEGEGLGGEVGLTWGSHRNLWRRPCRARLQRRTRHIPSSPLHFRGALTRVIHLLGHLCPPWTAEARRSRMRRRKN